MLSFIDRMRLSLAQRLQPNLPPELVIPEIEGWQSQMLAAVEPYTMTQLTALWATLQAVQYVHDRGIPGDFVECGVWRGGNTMIAGLMRTRLGKPFAIRAFDTFAGMTAPTEFDTKPGSDMDTRAKFERMSRGDHNDWCYASLEDVRTSFDRIVGNDDLITIKGSVMDTLADPANLPDHISVLRLDTDFYDSTKIELETLWPRLSVGGVLMIDDYGEWAGAKKAADEYFAGRQPWMHRIDKSVRLVIKTD